VALAALKGEKTLFGAGTAVRCGRHDMLHQPDKEVDFILGTKELEAEVLPNLSALMTLRSLVPFFLPKRFRQRAGLVDKCVTMPAETSSRRSGKHPLN
jgi:hypothetical protein